MSDALAQWQGMARDPLLIALRDELRDLVLRVILLEARFDAARAVAATAALRRVGPPGPAARLERRRLRRRRIRDGQP